ncbi:MAG: hypothetical protein RLZZ628_618 [Bacteroidota bacterium]|jgi:hypothetical protein
MRIFTKKDFIMIQNWLNVIYILLITIFLWTCNLQNKADANAPPKPSNLSGKALATLYCGNCHLQPTPDLLDKTTWTKSVLPEMAFYTGIRPIQDKMFNMSLEDITPMIQTGVYPSKPMLAQADWQKIVDYYVAEAPDTLPKQSKKASVGLKLPFFEIKTLSNADISYISMVKMDTLSHSFYIGHRNKLFVENYNSSFKKIDSTQVESPVSDIFIQNKEKYLLQMGIMDPNEASKGKLSKNSAQNVSTTLLDSLQRPVHLSVADLNQDGIDDYLICNYGNLKGKLACYDGKNRQEKVLKSLPGARNTIIRDMNHDGLADIVVLMCQAREGISIFYNQGQGVFKEEIVLQFPPVYGSSYMELADMNGDGMMDIVYTNGDNADFSMVLKPYHGLRIFLNEGQNHFKEQYFYPMYGASKVMTADFDNDGDLDMATIAFFPDANQVPHEGFLFFENKGNNIFQISTFANAHLGKWLVMDVGDLDGDGKKDILLGNYAKSKWAEAVKPMVVWLKNTSKN